MDTVLQRRAVSDQVQTEPGALALSPHRRVGKPDLRHQRQPAKLGQHPAIDLVGLAGKRRQPLHLDRILIVSRTQLERVLREYVAYYNTHRPHRSLEQQPPLVETDPV